MMKVCICTTPTLEPSTELYSPKKYGVDLIRFTHHQNAVICASKNGWDESIRYLSLHDNRYLKYFKGHRDRVVSLAMSPLDDTFISASLDETIRLWDLRSNACQGLLRLPHGRSSSVAFDPQGLIFAAAVENNSIKLYDLQSYDKGPFSTFHLTLNNPQYIADWHSLKFSNDGKYMLLSSTSPQSNENLIFLVDAFTGEKKQTFSLSAEEKTSLFEASFSPDGQFILAGAEDGTIHVWQSQTGKEVAVWKGHASGVGVVQWNPKSMMVASGCTNLVFWIPSELSEMAD